MTRTQIVFPLAGPYGSPIDEIIATIVSFMPGLPALSATLLVDDSNNYVKIHSDTGLVRKNTSTFYLGEVQWTLDIVTTGSPLPPNPVLLLPRA